MVKQRGGAQIASGLQRCTAAKVCGGEQGEGQRRAIIGSYDGDDAGRKRSSVLVQTRMASGGMHRNEKACVKQASGEKS